MPPGNVEAFTDAVLEFYNNRKLCKQFGENGYKLVSERFSMNRLAEDFSNVISNCSPLTKGIKGVAGSNNLMFRNFKVAVVVRTSVRTTLKKNRQRQPNLTFKNFKLVV